MLAGGSHRVAVGIGGVDLDRVGLRPGAQFFKAEIFERLLAGHGVGPPGAGRVFGGHQEIVSHLDGFFEIPGEHHLGHAAFENALADMAGEADQAVLLVVAGNGDAVVHGVAGLVSPEDEALAGRFEHHRAAIVRGVGLATAVVADDEEGAISQKSSAEAILAELDVADHAGLIAPGVAAGRTLDVLGGAKRRQQFRIVLRPHARRHRREHAAERDDGNEPCLPEIASLSPFFADAERSQANPISRAIATRRSPSTTAAATAAGASSVS